MSVADNLRQRAERLLVLALKARENEDPHSVELEYLAVETLAEAEAVERESMPPPSGALHQQPAQQQQQLQPDNLNDKE